MFTFYFDFAITLLTVDIPIVEGVSETLMSHFFDVNMGEILLKL